MKFQTKIFQNHNNNNYFKNKLNKQDIYYKKDKQKTYEGDREDNTNNSFINQQYIKQQLIKYIYETIDISKFKYKLIEYEYDLSLLKEMNYFISPNYNGINCLLVFIKIKDRFYSFMVDRRTLSYNINQVNIDNVKIFPVTVRLDKSIYNGTIIDGVLLYNRNKNKNRNFMINDIYYFRGNDLTQDKINFKLLNISTYLESYYKNDIQLNDITFFVNKLYEIYEIKKLVNDYIPKSKLRTSIKGLVFYPEISGTKLIYLYNNCSQDKEKVTSYPPITVSPIIKQVRDCINLDNLKGKITAVFRMKKTDTVDVYKLYLGKTIEKDNKKLLKYINYCLAYIPSKECSFFCKDLFEKLNTDSILVECQYVPDKDKWIPFKHAKDKKRPDNIDYVNEILNNLDNNQIKDNKTNDNKKDNNKTDDNKTDDNVYNKVGIER